MSWLSSFFNRDKVKVLTGLALTALKLFGVKQAENAWSAIENGVWRAERSGLTGPQKFQQVYDEVIAVVRDPKLYTWLLRAAIEICVGLMKEKAGELI